MSLTRFLLQIVDNELRKLDLENTLQHVRYLRSFLPDNFNKPGGKFFDMNQNFVLIFDSKIIFLGDNDGVLLNLFFPRLSAKVQLLICQLNDLVKNDLLLSVFEI